MIAGLLRSGSINAVSCMAALPGWPADAELLLEAANTNPQAEVGLHLTLSSEIPIGELSCLDSLGRLPGPDHLLGLCLTRRIRASEFAAEIDRQFDAFEASFGRAPDFVDAHQHVHVYPILRHLVVEAVARRAPRAWVRVPSDRLAAMLARPFTAKALGSALHSIGFRRLLRRHGLRANDSFAGHYDFRSGYSGLIDRFFLQRSGFHVVMCHPGSSDLAGDTIASARAAEAAVLAELPLHLRVSVNETRIPA